MRRYQAAILIFILSVATSVEATVLFKRRHPTPQLPEDDSRLTRDDDEGAHAPEQVSLNLSSVHAR